MATFHLQIVTPDRMAFDGQAQSVIVRTVGGDACILARHIDYVSPLAVGEARVIDAEGNERKAACAGGMLIVANGEVSVMATTFEWAEDIDLARAELAQQKAEKQLETLKREDKNFAVYEAKLKRALNRIRVKG